VILKSVRQICASCRCNMDYTIAVFNLESIFSITEVFVEILKKTNKNRWRAACFHTIFACPGSQKFDVSQLLQKNWHLPQGLWNLRPKNENTGSYTSSEDWLELCIQELNCKKIAGTFTPIYPSPHHFPSPFRLQKKCRCGVPVLLNPCKYIPLTLDRFNQNKTVIKGAVGYCNLL
jgi:hypothetical protein